MQYDWTDPVPQNMGNEEKQIYYKLRRLSRKTNNPDIWPDGRVWSEEEVVAALENEPIKKPVAGGEISPPDGESDSEEE